ncbi:mechanosensitive ion channel family protein [Luteimonas sp. S4-F44]|uniref:mechanosensitive ion channel family protein n=1 Tax=Luteimonas sp. S4-F44 TaxID=2925842 RepID=UPI001F538434|nr:mechanosensitive ion channel domain-containing protein [Luteimonas sp. S4-F44]UNK41131.1 mechanosensitive ion channel family protein [Luteimonas sp. S4-F44]
MTESPYAASPTPRRGRFRSLSAVVLLALVAGLLAGPNLAAPSPTPNAVQAASAAPDSGTAAGLQAIDTLPPSPAQAFEEADVRGRFDAVYDETVKRFTRLLANLPLLLAALLVVALAAWLGRMVSQRLHWLHLRTRNPYLDNLLRRMVQAAILLLGIVIALDLLNATAVIGVVFGSAGVLGIAMGFAFKDIAENYIAGILLSLRRPFEPGETVKIDSYEGRVASLSSRAMVLVTAEGNELRLPNALVFKAVILNYSSNPRRRFDFVMNIDASYSIRQAQAIGLAEIAAIDDVLTDPGPSWTLVEFGPSGSVLRFFGWVDQRKSDLGKTRGEAIRRVKGAFWRAGIQGPRNTTHVVLTRDEGAVPNHHDIEPATSVGVDTSVNRDIDEHVAEVVNADPQNLLIAKDAPQ